MGGTDLRLPIFCWRILDCVHFRLLSKEDGFDRVWVRKEILSLEINEPVDRSQKFENMKLNGFSYKGRASRNFSKQSACIRSCGRLMKKRMAIPDHP